MNAEQREYYEAVAAVNRERRETQPWYVARTRPYGRNKVVVADVAIDDESTRFYVLTGIAEDLAEMIVQDHNEGLRLSRLRDLGYEMAKPAETPANRQRKLEAVQDA